MPIYEYRCSSCGNEHEALQKLSEPRLTTCPSCGKETLTKLLSAAGFQLKGSGWYATDFRNGGKPAVKPDAQSDAKTETKSDGATADAKPAETKSESSKNESSKSESSKSESSTPAPKTPTTTSTD